MEGQFKEPDGVVVSPNGNVYVADTANNRVQEFTEKVYTSGSLARKVRGQASSKAPPV